MSNMSISRGKIPIHVSLYPELCLYTLLNSFKNSFKKRHKKPDEQDSHSGARIDAYLQ